MITFACKKIKQEELIRCSFELNKTGYDVLMFLLKNKETYSVPQIAKRMSLERTTVQKAIKSLLDRKLVKRRQKNLPRGGYIFFYRVNNKEEIKEKMKRTVYEWYKSVEKEIDKL